MPYTFKNLIDELQPILWPAGEAENLEGSHRQMMIEALMDLQTWVECLQINNTQVIPACDTLFKCGYTVLDAPRGRINRLYTIDRVNQDTGREDPAVPIDWCSERTYRQVEYSDLDRFISQTLAAAQNGSLWSWCNLAFASLAGIFAFPTCWQQKYATYPPPDDAGLDKAPPLPLGYHYAQTSTDSPNGLRAQWGMWALRGGQIFVAPWIQSTETIVVEWDGIKRSYNDLDLVDDDPNLKKAVEWYVRWQHALKYDRDYEAASAAVVNYNEARAVLIHECREETEIRDAAESVNSKARGAALVVPTFTNEPQTATAKCPQNTTGQPVTVTVPSGTVASIVSVADANAQARSLALQQAGVQLTCTPNPVTYLNTAQSFTAQCQSGTGQPVTITVDAGTVTSTVSQAAADAAALAQATTQALAALTCTFSNTQQSFTAHCPVGHPGSDVTRTIPAGAFTSTLSQADADAQALAEATSQATAALSCAGSPTVYLNTVQTVHVTLACATSRGNFALSTNVTVPAGTYSSQVSQADANNQAIAYANSKGRSILQLQCQSLQAGSPTGGTTPHFPI
jgi:hypothetical protein